MSVSEFKYSIRLITSFIDKMTRETIPADSQRIIIKTYAAGLSINLTEKMLNSMII